MTRSEQIERETQELMYALRNKLCGAGALTAYLAALDDALDLPVDAPTPVPMPREPTEAMFEAGKVVLARGEARWLWTLMHDAYTKENAK